MTTTVVPASGAVAVEGRRLAAPPGSADAWS
jgi:hypothetical protein